MSKVLSVLPLSVIAAAVLIGIVSAGNCPAVTGTGALEILPKGTMLIVR